MRVIAGELGGRRLVAPPGRTTRPTSDRVREAVFNALGSLGLLDDADVLDIYAGSGALGIEALSRGAASATFVEQDGLAIASIEENVDALGCGDRSDVVRADAQAWLSSASRSFDLALIDPPYGFDAWERLLQVVPARWLVVESDRELGEIEALTTRRCRRYGATVVTFYERCDAVNGREEPT